MPIPEPSVEMALHEALSVDLKPFNTFGLSCIAERVLTATAEDDVRDAVGTVAANDSLSLVLGGGSNLLFTQERLTGTVLHINLLGKHVVSETDDAVVVEAAAGEPWHPFVLWTLENGWGGLENLSLIPGNVGTTPVQNVGAYGVETKDVCTEVRFVERGNGTVHTFSAADCAFGYRDSVFKHATQTVQAVVTSLESRINIQTIEPEFEPAELAMNDIGEIRIKTAKPIVFDGYGTNRLTGAFILIEQGTNATVAAGMLNPPMEAVERIEFIRGGASLQFGPQFGGMLNYVTKEGSATKPFSFESFNTIGSYNLRSTFNAVGGTFKKIK